MSPMFNQKLSHSTLFKMKIWWFQTQRLLKLKRGMTLKSWQRKRLFSRKQNKLSRKWMVCLSRNCQTQAPYKISTAKGFSKIGQTNKGDKFNVNNSFIQINTDPSQDMMQSMIQITVEKWSPCFDQFTFYLEKGSKLPSKRANNFYLFSYLVFLS